MVDRAISHVSDETTREALMALRTEFYNELTKQGRLVTQMAKDLSSHIAVVEDERKATEQWRQSMSRIVEKHFDEDDRRFDLHTKEQDFEAYRERTDARISWAYKWLVGTLTTFSIGLLGTVVALAAKLHGGN